jgi:hypothetical protein
MLKEEQWVFLIQSLSQRGSQLFQAGHVPVVCHVCCDA